MPPVFKATPARRKEQRDAERDAKRYGLQFIGAMFAAASFAVGLAALLRDRTPLIRHRSTLVALRRPLHVTTMDPLDRRPPQLPSQDRAGTTTFPPPMGDRTNVLVTEALRGSPSRRRARSGANLPTIGAPCQSPPSFRRGETFAIRDGDDTAEKAALTNAASRLPGVRRHANPRSISPAWPTALPPMT
jgi:hypothetical protein